MVKEVEIDTQNSEADNGNVDELTTLRTECEAAIRKAEENKDLLLRAHAEMDNLRKRATRDVENAHKYALEKFVAALLPVSDGLDSAVESLTAAKDADKMREGLILLSKMFDDVLGKFGVQKLDPKGAEFNPLHHEALSMQDTLDAIPGTVLTVIQKGYLLNDRLLRPARVVVARGQAPEPDEIA